MKIQRQEWIDMSDEQKQFLLKQRIIESRNKVVNNQWTAMLMDDKQMFQQYAKVCRLFEGVLATS
ncbi:hypothetical protein P4311_17510 [Bacillus thuringiensis]|nr:hypothetical protein [Bacillus thuringiensis]MRB58668.1 hypothetical protein [Bacillus thuringiensis]